MENQKVIDKANIMKEDSGRYIWSIMIKKKK